MDDEPQWQITIRVPMCLPAAQKQALFNAVAAAVHRWEPVDRAGWDADVSGHPSDEAPA